jgi:Na+/H+ antiporter NhaD/arsenite permease-like protein
MASNMGSTATITGNPQNMIIGSLSHIPYGTFAAALSPIAGIGLVLTAVLIGLSYRCRAQNLEPQCFRLTKGDGRLLLPEQDGGGMGASVVWMGDRGLFQI